MFTIEVKDTGVNDALNALAAKVGNMRPILQTIGEDIMERTKQRFVSSTGPDGQRWQPNALSTIQAMMARESGSFAFFSNIKTRKKGLTRVGDKKGYFLKDGITLSKKAQTSLAGKKPLIDSGSLSNQFHVRADANSVTVGNSMIYAAIHQFGGQAGRGRKVSIPARPFLPIRENGYLYADEQNNILAALNGYLAGK